MIDLTDAVPMIGHKLTLPMHNISGGILTPAASFSSNMAAEEVYNTGEESKKDGDKGTSESMPMSSDSTKDDEHISGK